MIKKALKRPQAKLKDLKLREQVNNEWQIVDLEATRKDVESGDFYATRTHAGQLRNFDTIKVITGSKVFDVLVLDATGIQVKVISEVDRPTI